MSSSPPAGNSDLESRLIGAGLCTASAFGFATLSIFGKLAFAEGLSMAGFLSLRFGGAALLLLIVLGIRMGRAVVPERRLLVALFLLGAVGYFTQSAFYFLGLQRIPASLSSVLLYVYPAFVALNVWVLEGRRPTRLELGAIALALVGATLTAGPWEALAGGGPDLLGVLFVLGAAAGYGIYIVVSNRYVHRAGRAGQHGVDLAGRLGQLRTGRRADPFLGRAAHASGRWPAPGADPTQHHPAAGDLLRRHAPCRPDGRLAAEHARAGLHHRPGSRRPQRGLDEHSVAGWGADPVGGRPAQPAGPPSDRLRPIVSCSLSPIVPRPGAPISLQLCERRFSTNRPCLGEQRRSPLVTFVA